MEETILNRLNITGVLDETTPFCVVKEILQAHNISSAQIEEKDIKFSQIQTEVNKINSYRPITLMGSLEKNIRYVATFVNPVCKSWTKKSLLKAYNHMMNFSKDNIEIFSSISYSQKDIENPEAYNACMLYGLCKKYGIDTHWKMSGHHMANLLQKLSVDTNHLRTGLVCLLESLNRTQLINIYALLDQNTKKGNQVNFLPEGFTKKSEELDNKPMSYLDSEKIVQCHKKFTDSRYLLFSIIPKTHFEAIVLVGMIYNLNITESKFPLQEFQRLNETKNIDMYVPFDSIFRKKFLHNKSWYNLYHHWCQELTFLYSDKDLKKFCVEEGYSSDDFRNFDALSLLHMSRISLNVYLGKNVYNLEQEYTPILMDDISELANSECLTFGILSEPESLKTYSVKEVSEMLMNLKNYVNPENTKEALSSKNGRKLYSIATQLNDPTFIKAIGIVEKWKQYSNEFSESLRNLYTQNPKVLDYLTKILESAMYMRGWKTISEKYPLSENETKLSDSELQFEIEQKVFSSIQETQTWIQTVSEEEASVLKRLPLMRFSHEAGNKVFVLTPDPEDGTSMLHRLEIVLLGNKYKNTKSCIRLSSNILLHSVYFYLCSLGLPEPFNIFELENIT